MTGWTVRAAEAREAAALTAFGRRVFAATFAPDNEACQLERYLATEYTLEAQASELADPAIMTLLACDGADTILGFVQLRRGVPPLCVADAEPIELWRFYVDQPWHGQGVASVLMQAVRDTAVDGAARTMWPDPSSSAPSHRPIRSGCVRCIRLRAMTSRLILGVLVTLIWMSGPLAGGATAVLRAQPTTLAAPRLQAGAATTNITPPLGASLVGNWAPSPATYVHDQLHARCLVLDDGVGRLAIVVVDSLGVPRHVLDQAKRLASEHTGIPAARILISATHTHSAPSALGERWSPADYDLAPTLDSYQAFLATRIADGIRGAVANLQPAQVTWGRSELADEVFNRRWFMKPGPHLANPFGGTDQVQMNPGVGSPNLVEPAGPTDPEIAFLAVRRADGVGTPLAVLANYSLHYVGGVPEGHVSADYYGVFARTMARLLGEDRADSRFVAMLSNGTSGDINNVDVRGNQPRLPAYARMERVAVRVAAGVYQGLQHLAWRDHVSLAAAERTVTLQRRPITTEMQAWAKAALARPADAPRHPRERIYADRIQGSTGAPPTLDVMLQAFLVGDLAITTFPFEVFAEIGLEIKAKSPFAQTFTTSLANGSEGYLPTSRQHGFGGYETWLGTSRVEPDAARMMTDALLEMLAGLAASRPARPAAP